MCRERTNPRVGILLNEGGSETDHMSRDMAPASERVNSLGSASGSTQKLWFCPDCRVRSLFI